MTREEEIAVASAAFGSRGSSLDFTVGAKWADNNPKSHWTSVEDYLPKQDEEVIVLCDNLNSAPFYKIAFGHIVDKTICKNYNGWNIPNVVYWFPMPKLPSEFKI